MEIKGSLVKSIYKYVNDNFKDEFDLWINALSTESRKIYQNVILATNWYPLNEGIIEPIKITGKFFFDDDAKKAAFELGRHSASTGLSGIYKVFVRIASPQYVLSRSSNIFKTYYKNLEIKYETTGETSAKIFIDSFKEEESLVFDRILGWIYEALIILKKTPGKLFYKFQQNLNGYVKCEIFIEWF